MAIRNKLLYHLSFYFAQTITTTTINFLQLQLIKYDCYSEFVLKYVNVRFYQISQ